MPLSSLLLAALTILLSSSDGWAKLYLLQLKGGGQYLTTRYWADGVEIRFEFEDGIMGVPQETVIQVDDVSDKVEFRPKRKVQEETTKEHPAEIALDTASGTAKPQDQAQFLTYQAEMKAFEEQAMAPGPLRTKPEILALGQKGMDLKKQILANQNLQPFIPIVERLEDVLDRLEEDLERAR